MDPDQDPDADPSIFIIDLQDANKKLTFQQKFSCILLFHNFSKIKFKKKSQNSRNQGFSYYIGLMIEGSGSRSRAGSGSIPLTNGSGSGSRRPKSMWIRIRNTAFLPFESMCCLDGTQCTKQKEKHFSRNS
jgi:hypothetical protein